MAKKKAAKIVQPRGEGIRKPPIASKACLAEWGAHLRAMREARGWLLVDLANRTSMTITSLSKLERGVNAPAFGSLLALKEALGCKMSELMATVE